MICSILHCLCKAVKNVITDVTIQIGHHTHQPLIQVINVEPTIDAAILEEMAPLQVNNELQEPLILMHQLFLSSVRILNF